MINIIKRKWKNLKYKLNFKYRKIDSRKFDKLTEQDVRYALEVQFKQELDYKLKLDNPKTFNEKIQWIKFYYHDPLMVQCSDKVEARNYIKSVVGEKYLVPCLGVYNSPKEIDFDKLPNQFVIKTNWAYKQNILCKDKSKFDINDAINKLTEWTKPERNFYYAHFEWQYKDIKPKIVCEKFLLGKSGKYVTNYKFLCFNGKYKYLMIPGKNKEMKIFFNIYDRNLNLQPFTYGNVPNNKELELKINNYNEMITIAEKLAKPFPFVRVDLYEDGDGKIYVGELTFTPFSGTKPFNPIEWDYKFGELLKLPQKI